MFAVGRWIVFLLFFVAFLPIGLRAAGPCRLRSFLVHGFVMRFLAPCVAFLYSDFFSPSLVGGIARESFFFSVSVGESG